ncbi:MAG: VWA domain-containing protein [Nibricoccus sp.]
MNFHWPHAFWFLLVPLLLAIADFRRRRAAAATAHPKIIRAEAGSQALSLLSENAPQHSGARLRWRLWLGLVLATVALARPQWGKLDEPVFDQAREIIIALDLSRSMNADDVRPSRLERAKLLVSSLLEQLHGERVGLVVFSGTSFLQSPLSADYEILRDFLPGMNPSYLPEGGTNYTALLQTSLNAFGSSGSADRYLVILSDGEATDEDWKTSVKELKEKGIRVIGLGVGTSSGAMIPNGSGGFVKDERGAVVLSKLESATLQQLATDTNGVYADASSWVDIAQLLESTVEKGKRGTFVERSRVRLAERFQWALAPALFFLFWFFWWELPVRARLRDVRVAPHPNSSAKPAPAATTTLQSLTPLLILLVSILGSSPTQLNAAEKEPAPVDALAKLVGKLSSSDSLRVEDYADLAHSTIDYGKNLQSTQKHVPPGPVNDALAGVDLGEALDKKAADWPALRHELEALLKKKEQPPQQQPQQSPQDKKEDQQKKDQQQQQQQQQKQNSEPQKQDKPEQQPQSEKQQDQEQQKQNQQQQSAPPDNQSAFGDMKNQAPQKSDKPPQPNDPTEQQKVGGAEKKDGGENKDPSLAVPLQKLEQLKDQDSPATLYQLMQGQTQQPKKPAKDW